MLSHGSGVCSHETVFAGYKCFSEILCVDFSEKLLAVGEKTASLKGLSNMKFQVFEVNTITIQKNYYDIVLFHSSLHPFKNVGKLLEKVFSGMQENGLLNYK